MVAFRGEESSADLQLVVRDRGAVASRGRPVQAQAHVTRTSSSSRGRRRRDLAAKQEKKAGDEAAITGWLAGWLAVPVVTSCRVAMGLAGGSGRSGRVQTDVTSLTTTHDEDETAAPATQREREEMSYGTETGDR